MCWFLTGAMRGHKMTLWVSVRQNPSCRNIVRCLTCRRNWWSLKIIIKWRESFGDSLKLNISNEIHPQGSWMCVSLWRDLTFPVKKSKWPHLKTATVTEVQTDTVSFSLGLCSVVGGWGTFTCVRVWPWMYHNQLLVWCGVVCVLHLPSFKIQRSQWTCG